MFLLTLLLLLNVNASVASLFGPVYPVTAGWFKDRFSKEEWNKTLTDFAAIGGDTVLLRGPAIQLMTKDSLKLDPEFQWCGSTNSSTGETGMNCIDEAVQDLQALGLKPQLFGKFSYEENFSDKIMACPQYDRKIVSGRTYYRLVLPLDVAKLSHPCDLNGTQVLLLFTSFAGVDPHELLLESAEEHNMTVYLGLPEAPQIFNHGRSYINIYVLVPHIEMVRRFVTEQIHRYSGVQTKSGKSLYDVVDGYNSAVKFQLTDMFEDSLLYQEYFENLKNLTTMAKKKLLVSPFMELNRFENQNAVDSHIAGFERLAKVVDVVAMRDGRGLGRGGFYWSTQNNTNISIADPILDNILHFQYPTMKRNITYGELFVASVQTMFDKMAQSRDALVKSGTKVDLWLTIDSYHHLRDDPCLPVDRAGSGIPQELDRVVKSEIDWTLMAAGPNIQKVSALAWDPSFTCVTKQRPARLAAQIKNDLNRPIIASCFLHSRFNRSVVVIGYNLLALTQGFTVDWTDYDNKKHSDNVHGYYFEADWGDEHNRVASLLYTQLYDPYDVSQLSDHGYIRVSAEGGYHPCMFIYDFRDYGNETSIKG